jgi:TM2 domain-containing membrane protein YozV
MAIIPIKSKGLAYFFWFFLGLFGAHKFYLNKIGVGLLYLFTGGVFGIGWLIDLFTLSGQVDVYNALHGGLGASSNNNQNNIVVNVSVPPSESHLASSSSLIKLSPEKQILTLADKVNVLSIKQIVSQTTLELDEAEEAVKKLVSKGIAKEQVDPNGRLTYNFS